MATSALRQERISLPKRFVDGSCGCAVDIGGSLIKVACVAKEQNDDSETTDTRTVLLATFRISDLLGAISYIKDVAKRDVTHDTMTTTGVSVRGDVIETFKRELGQDVDVMMETLPMQTALLDLVRFLSATESMVTMPRELVNESRVFRTKLEGMFGMMQSVARHWEDQYKQMDPELQQQPRPEHQGTHLDVVSYVDPYEESRWNRPAPFAEANRDMFPCLLSSVGTGCNLTKLSVDGHMEPIGGSNRSGRTLMGLSSLLIGVHEYDELMVLAAKGDLSTVTKLMKENKTPRKDGETENAYDCMPDDLRIFSFGKVCGKSVDDFRKEDLALALIYHMSDDLAANYRFVCKSYDCKSVIVCGGLVEHPIVRHALWSAFSGYSRHDGLFEMFFPRLGSYLPAIGCLRHNAFMRQTTASS